MFQFEQGYATTYNYNNNLPIIGWFARRQLGYVIVIAIIVVLLYYFFYKEQDNIIGQGCIRNSCYATPSIGSEVNGDNCIGIGCHAGDCYGEGCHAGTCEGVGCVGGNCYGANCIVGKCKDPNCTEDKEQLGICKPNCKWGRAYDMVQSNSNTYRSFKNVLKKNTYFNKNNCIKPTKITENLIKDDKTLYNIRIKGANYYNGDFLSLDEIKAKLAKGVVIDDKKGLVRYEDPIISTIPYIYKNDTCNWCTKHNGISMCAKYAPTFNQTNINNVDQYNYNWSSFRTPVPIFGSKGEETMCPATLNQKPHSMTNIKIYLDIDQIKDILGSQSLTSKMANVDIIEQLLKDGNYSAIKSYMDSTDFFQDNITVFQLIDRAAMAPANIMIQLEDVHGTIMNCTCDNCQQTGNRTLVYSILPTDLFGTVLPCKPRAYLYTGKTENYDPDAVIDRSKTTYTLTGVKRPVNDTFTTDELTFTNEFHSIRDHHLMLYINTDVVNKVMTYICLFCGKISNLYLDKLITIDALIGQLGQTYALDSCIRPDDYNHYYIEELDEEQEKVNYKCIKCNKTTK
jgi:DNA-directed RNA polymerase subunit RPC12/RpoP